MLHNRKMMMMRNGSVHCITGLCWTIAGTICVKCYSGWLVRGLFLPLLKVCDKIFRLLNCYHGQVVTQVTNDDIS